MSTVIQDGAAAITRAIARARAGANQNIAVFRLSGLVQVPGERVRSSRNNCTPNARAREAMAELSRLPAAGSSFVDSQSRYGGSATMRPLRAIAREALAKFRCFPASVSRQNGSGVSVDQSTSRAIARKIRLKEKAPHDALAARLPRRRHGPLSPHAH